MVRPVRAFRRRAIAVSGSRGARSAGRLSAAMRVWIDQDLCTGDGLCVDHCHDVFEILEDGIAYVREGGRVLNDPGGSGSLADVAPRHEHAVIQVRPALARSHGGVSLHVVRASAGYAAERRRS